MIIISWWSLVSVREKGLLVFFASGSLQSSACLDREVSFVTLVP